MNAIGLDVWLLTAADVTDLCNYLKRAIADHEPVRVAWDDGLKVKAGHGIWSLPLGRKVEA